ncbi:MAG: WD40 repeat domain-containing protein [Arcobacteraceae bacterium]|jgi:WD40 repeat protein|nr:WD40 repeat domain-containing protein [Arcobacteraceae bacterium]
MIKIILFILTLGFYAHSMETLTPTFSLKAKGDVQDILYTQGVLYAANSNGSVELFDVASKHVIKTIEIPPIEDFMGDVIPAKIYSIDLIANKLLIVSQGMKGYRNLWIYENDTLHKVFDIEKKYFIQKASFVDENRILFGLLSNQIGLYNLQTQSLEYMKQVSHSSFSHFKLSQDKQRFASTDESGIVRIFNAKDGSLFKELDALNLDRVYQVDYKNGVVLTAGQDRKAVVFSNNGSAYSLNFDFLLYSCALNEKATRGAVSYNEKNEVLVFDINTQKYLYNLTGQKATLTQILFISDNELFASSDSEIINYWKF